MLMMMMMMMIDDVCVILKILPFFGSGCAVVKNF